MLLILFSIVILVLSAHRYIKNEIIPMTDNTKKYNRCLKALANSNLDIAIAANELTVKLNKLRDGKEKELKSLYKTN